MINKKMRNVVDIAEEVIAIEVAAINAMSGRLGVVFKQVVELIVNCSGRVVVVGMGKSGIIGRKIAATLASTGTPSFFVHPAEAFHGDLGMIGVNDVLLMISNSGETEELIRILPFLNYQKNSIVAFTGYTRSTLAKNSDLVLDTFVQQEACNNNLAPTCSTTVALVLGDALAVTLSTVKGFQAEDFARFHPGGNLGRKLLTRVRDVMHSDRLPIISSNELFRDVVDEINKGGLGLILVVECDELVGIITDGDIRRAIDLEASCKGLKAMDLMSKDPVCILAEDLLSSAEDIMKSLKIGALVVKEQRGDVVGVINIYDK